LRGVLELGLGSGGLYGFGGLSWWRMEAGLAKEKWRGVLELGL
jgi:hypothetical protein